MLPKKKLFFVINPISGGKSKTDFPDLVKKVLDTKIFEYEYAFTERAMHAYELTSQAFDNGFDIVIAVGGDGTVNEVASATADKKGTMSIIPLGSGNGLSRSLQIPMSKVKALKHLSQAKCQTIDTGKFNGKRFFNVAGIGFDAYISASFQAMKTRGFTGYASVIMRGIRGYYAKPYRIQVDGYELKTHAYMVTVANSSQYGNNVHIAPNAVLHDGLLDVSIMLTFPKMFIPTIGYKMLNKSIHTSRYNVYKQGKSIKIFREEEDFAHVDGEPFWAGKEIDIQILPNSLNVFC